MRSRKKVIHAKLCLAMLCHSYIGAAAPSAHLPRPTKLSILACLIKGDVDRKYKASILTHSPFNHCLHPHLTIHRLYPFKAPILVYKRAHSYIFTERLSSNETSQRETLFDRMWRFRFHFNELKDTFHLFLKSQ